MNLALTKPIFEDETFYLTQVQFLTLTKAAINVLSSATASYTLSPSVHFGGLVLGPTNFPLLKLSVSSYSHIMRSNWSSTIWLSS